MEIIKGRWNFALKILFSTTAYLKTPLRIDNVHKHPASLHNTVDKIKLLPYAYVDVLL